MESSPKRTVQVNVKMTGEDFALMERAARKLWPGAIISNSGVLLSLAKMAAQRALSSGRRKGG